MRLRVLDPLLRSNRPARTAAPSSSAAAAITALQSGIITRTPFFTTSRALAQVHPDHAIPVSVSFARSQGRQNEVPIGGPRSDHQPPDERTLKLGKSKLRALQPCPTARCSNMCSLRPALRILQARLPNLLASPLPPEILSPHISLHLFPSTHPHLPTVSGRVAYHAALWTSPITWGRVPLLGNVNLEVQSERMVKNGTPTILGDYSRDSAGCSYEKLIVRWRTCGKTKGLGTGANFRGIGAKQTVDKITMWLGGAEKRDDEEFCGLFIFEFDEEGRVLRHVIERAEGGDGWDTEPSKWIALTDWLLGRFGKGFAEREPGLALGYERLGRKGGTRDHASARRD